MLKRNFDFVGHIKTYIAIPLVICLIGVVMTGVFGINLDINFKGGSRFTFTYKGEISLNDAQSTVEQLLGKQVEISQSTDISGASAKLLVSVVGNEAVTTETQQALTAGLQEKFADNNVQLGDFNTVNPTIARSFFLKSLAAVALACILVVAYIGIRFRKIGGVSAGAMAFVALVHDGLIVFFTTVIFRLQVDMNFIAVVLTILGYSLNDTVVVYDRVRENKSLRPNANIVDLVNDSSNQVLVRSITISFATFMAVMTILVVGEIYGLDTIRSFTIPMAVGVIAGSYSSVCIAAPLWVKWVQHAERVAPIKAQKLKDKKAAAKGKSK